jgi:hypothetical protein
MQGANGVALDAGNKQLVCILVCIFNEVNWCLLSRNGNKRDALVRRLEPNDLGALDGSTTRFITAVTFSLTTLGFLLLLGSSG